MVRYPPSHWCVCFTVAQVTVQRYNMYRCVWVYVQKGGGLIMGAVTPSPQPPPVPSFP